MLRFHRIKMYEFVVYESITVQLSCLSLSKRYNVKMEILPNILKDTKFWRQ